MKPPILRLATVNGQSVLYEDLALASPETERDLYATYQAAHAAWHNNKSEALRLAARDAYNAWSDAFLGPDDSAAVTIQPKATWGFN